MVIDEKKYRWLAGVFEDSFQLISVRVDRDSYPQWELVSKNVEDRFDDGLQRAADILCIETPQELKWVYDIRGKDFAHNSGRWRSFIGEIVALFNFDEYGFENLRKIKSTRSMPTPDYFAAYNSIPYVIEFKHKKRSIREEFKAIDHNAYDKPKLDKSIGGMIEEKRFEFERQLSVYPNYRKIAAFGYEGLTATATFMNDFTAKEIARPLLSKATGKIDHVFIMSTELRSSYLVPSLSQ